MYQCPSCGAGLEFDPKSQMLKCHYCNNSYKPDEIEKTKLHESNADKDVYDALVYRCTQCGAELITTDETIATFCSYCGSSALLEKRNEKKHKPNYVIPFTKTKEECEEAYRKRLKRAFFAPKNMAEEQQIEKIRGIYMPYWIYSFEKNGDVSATSSTYSRRVGDYVYYKDYRITSTVKARSSGISHDATSNFSDSLSEAIAPYSIKDKKEFSPTYLSGFYADSEDVEKETYYEETKEVVDDQASKELAKDPVFSKYSAKPNVGMALESTELGLFPVYFLATKNKTGDRISYAVVNGQTGKVAAEIPIDFKKYIITSLILAVPIFILLNLAFTLTPTRVLILAIIFGIISLVISSSQAKKIFNRENNIEDKGFMYKKGKKIEFNRNRNRKMLDGSVSPIAYFAMILLASPIFMLIIGLFEVFSSVMALITIIIIAIISISIITSKKKDKVYSKEKMKFSDKIKKTHKPLIGIVIAIIIFILKPVSDLYYYGGAVISIAMAIWSFYDIIKELNLLTTRKLPQLEKRGGDENA